MLVLSRKSQEAVVVDGRKSVVTILESQAGEVRPGFEINADVPVHCEEDWERIRAAAGETC